MLNLYVAPSSASSRKARKWLMDHGIDFKERNITRIPLNADEIKRILRLTENGSEDIISTRSNAFRKLHVNLDSLTVSQLIELMVQHPDLIRRPLIFNDEQLQVGFSEEDIRSFLPRSVREASLQQLMNKIS
ncbi:Spx/MgsR family RNA polymerase-binding regulatory protein [Lentilactobacillus parafarraginis]|jgi:regulatory protein spx|uniref:Regulatory protein spx n=3 Tax=Lentilactobacillus parafarraginis TaxID=390842 RepID=A0A0R1Y6F9_9LACO|nr:transcriptional regulator Spx [Lentilactobacillus parafarraginis]EHL95177.1 regulatory protein spx [Lentilactobacillus parafarraginis F0439]KRM37970.1 regulatory protein spx [Lentilactobacillus parafarraginis DSM 18390 = JCM 14109]TLQ20288.1 Spx/MgsR family RNA polymerase-binding regulatory protein [Lentilactobacillus parafarraginis]